MGTLPTTRDVFPASFAQERLWLFAQLEPDVAAYNLSMPFRCRSAAEAERSVAALTEIVARHEPLRTALADEDGRLVQIVYSSIPGDVLRCDLSDLPPAEAQRQCEEILAADARQAIGLERAPLWRARLVRLPGDEWLFQVVVHHAIFDARSTELFIAEFLERRQAMVEGREPVLPELSLQYVDYAAWARERSDSGLLDEQLGYWLTKLADLPAGLDLPADRPRPARKSYTGGDVWFQLPHEIGAGVRSLARQLGATPFMVYLAGYQALLSRLSGQSDIAVGAPVSGRETPELLPLLGMFVNTLVLRTDCSGSPTFRELVRRVRTTVVEGLDHQDVPFERLVALLRPEPDPSRSPLYQAGFNLLPLDRQTSNGSAKYDILLDLWESDGGVHGRIEYSTDLFEERTAEAFAQRLSRLLVAALAEPDTPISQLPLLGNHERARALHGGLSAQGRRAPSLLLTELFEHQVEQHLESVAVVDASRHTLSYGELNRKANRLAHHLIALGVGVESPVALFLEPDADLPVATLGILKAGAAYLPLDPRNPPERVAALLADSGAVAVVTNAALRGHLPAIDIPVVNLDDEALAGLPIDTPPQRAHPESLAYVIYTSGSTGQPKGVGVSHGNVAAYLDGLGGLLDLAPGRVFSMLAPLTFDFSVTMFYGALLSGGTLHVAPRDLAADAGWVARHLRRERVDYLKVTPSHLSALLAAVDDPVTLLPRRALVLGGEASRWEEVRALRERAPHCAVVNHYGPTETTVGVLALPGDREAARECVTTPIGWPLAHAEAYVLDEHLEPVPDGVVGELYVGGPQVSRGYLGHPGLTAERFVPNPHAQRRGARLYRTGDRARRLPDGALEFLGRFDDQVKVRGYRIEPDEIRLILASHPEVADAAVVVRGDTQPQLVAYAVPVPGADLDPDALRRDLSRRLPEFMVPNIVVLDQLPLTPHGKVDRSQLPDPGAVPASDVVVEPPRTATEETVASLFARLLRRDWIGRDEGFFALGGHSLLATQLVARLRATFDVELPLRDVFEAPTVAGLAQRLEQERTRGARRLPPIPRLSRESLLPASFGQQRLWFLDQLEQAGPLYNTNLRLRVRGELDPAVLRRALVEIVTRHEVLRTRFISREGVLIQDVRPEPVLPFSHLDLSDRPAAEREEAASRALDEHAERRFDLLVEPPVRVLLVWLGEQEHLLLLTVHHIASDAGSSLVIMRELRELYQAYLAGRTSPLPALTVQYADYAGWQRHRVEGELRKTQLMFWRERLAGMPARLELPTDRPRPRQRGFAGAHAPLRIPQAVADNLRTLAADEDATLYMAMLAGFMVLLARYAGQDDVVVGTPAANRPRPELEPLVGFFLNTLVLRVDCSGKPTFRELLRRVRSMTLDAFGNQEIPFETLVEDLQPERDLSGSPLVQVLFSLEDVERVGAHTKGLSFDWEPFGNRTAKFDVSLLLWRRAEGITGAVEYRTDLFDAETMTRFAERYVNLLTAAATDADAAIGRLPLLTDSDTARIERWNDTGRGYPVGTLPGLVAAQVARTPDAPAVGSGGAWVSYAQFGAAVNRLARYLRGRGVGPEDVVGVCLERGLEQVVALHAVVAAGAAYLPLEPAYPAERLGFMVADAGARLVLTRAELAGNLPTEVAGATVVCLDQDAAVITAQDPSPAPVALSPDALAYVLYTSGSTGRPKGVGVTHRAIVNRLCWMQEAIPLTGADRVVLKTPFSFDVSVWEFFWPLITGAGVVLTDPAGHRDPDYLAGVIAADRATTIHFVPSMLAAFLTDPDLARRAHGLRRVVCSGEALPPAVADRFHTLLPGVALHNLYGPTEAAVDVTWHTCTPGEPVIPIGRPVANTRIEILDPHTHRVPVGVTGELCIAGVQLARGYLGRPALTAERFIPDPHGHPGDRLYRTGDLARWLPTGDLEYLGRNDHQIKLRGFRIELGEIETHLAAHPEVHAAVATIHHDPTGPRLIAYLVTDPTTDTTDTDWPTRLRTHLPDHMIPTQYIPLTELPLTPNGKLNRAALPPPGSPDSGRATFDEPAGPVERLIVAAWSEVLGLNDIGAHDNFFALGGDSIRSLKVVAGIRAAGYRIELQQIFLHQTVRGLAEALDPATAPFGAASAPYALVDEPDRKRLEAMVGPTEDAYPLTALQAGMLFHSEYETGGATYHDVFSVRVHTRYDRSVLVAALGELIERHPVLRTSFHLSGFSEPIQVVHRGAVSAPLEEIDLSSLDADEVEERLTRWQDEEKRRRFDWAQAPLLRVVVHRLSGELFSMALSFHHAILDGWSVASLVTELLRRYEAGSRGVLLREDPPAVSFRDFVAREKAVVAAPEAVEFWRGVVAGGSVSQLPRLPGFPVDGSADVEVVPASLGPDLAAGLERVARELRVPLRTVLLAAHLRVLGLVSGDADVTTGLVTHGRPEHAAGAEVLGLFLNTVPLRVRVDTASWAELIRDVFAAEVALLPHRHFPLFEMLRATARPALFDTLFDYRDFHIYAHLPADEQLRVTGYSVFGQTDLPFTANVIRSPGGGFDLRLKFSRAQFPRGQVEAVRGYYLRALADIAAGPAGDPRLTAGYLGADDTARIERWNDTGRGYPVGTLPGLVAAQVARTPDAPAVGSGGAWVSYAQFGAAVNRLARYLRGRGVGPEDVVGVCLERGLEQVVALHAVVAAGAAYLPLEPAYPAERLGFMVADAGARLVLTRAELAGNLPTEVAGATVVCLDQDAAVITAQDPSPAPVALSPDALAYVLYTSGSTGRPKGVGVTHRAIVNRLCWMQEAIPLTGADRVVLKTPFSFDVSVWEFFWPLITGAGVVLTDPAGHRDPDYLAGVIAADRATTIHFVPSMLAAFLTDPDLARRAHGLRRVVCSGEALPPAVADRFHTLLPGVALHNLYGPTEAAVDVTWHTCTPGEPVIPIGRPVANTRIEILDPHTHRVPVGVTGELCIAGVQLARGYLGRPALTAERFIPDPHGHPGDRLYRTGDLARWLPTGDLEYLGRNDHQIKLRGFRIELGEIETHLAAHPEVHAAVATIHHDPTGPRLIAYLVTDPTTDTTDTDWPTRLRTHLPDHMIPTQYIPLTELPLTPNGKLNRAALPDPIPVSSDVAYEAPATDAEHAVAEAWTRALGAPRVGAHDDFFALGGDSIRSLTVVALLRDAGYQIQLQQLFAHPTVRDLAAAITPMPAGRTPEPDSAVFALLGEKDLTLLTQRFPGGPR